MSRDSAAGLFYNLCPNRNSLRLTACFESQTLLWRVQRLGRWGWKGKLPGLCPAGTAEQCWVVLRVRTAVLPPPHLVLLLTWRWKNHGLNELSGFRWPAFHPPLSSWRWVSDLDFVCSLGFFRNFPESSLGFAVLLFLGEQWRCCCSFSCPVAARAAAAPSPCSSLGTWPQHCPSTDTISCVLFYPVLW